MTEAYPLRWPDGWPRTPAHRRRSRFIFKNNTPFRAHTRILEELRLLKVEYIVVSSNAPTLRREGTMSAAGDTLLDDPGVAIYFRLGGRPMVMAQDLYETPAANLRSLGIAIEAMRAIERHGGGHMMQRSFDGFAQLPPPDGSTSKPQRPWRAVLGIEGIQLEPEFMRPIIEDRYKKLAKERHPDMPGGSHDAFAELNLAVEVARQELAA